MVVTSTRDQRKALNIGADAYLDKPDPARLIKGLEETSLILSDEQRCRLAAAAEIMSKSYLTTATLATAICQAINSRRRAHS